MQTEQVVPDTWRDLNSTERDILYVLAVHGRQVGVDISKARGRGVENMNTVTRRLPDLRERGLITSEYAADRPSTSEYHELTDKGWDVVHDSPLRVE
jgi:DNA-binding HxlR family transcriptional regulator